jgi:Skp family chaperone for outer membrane proteins
VTLITFGPGVAGICSLVFVTRKTKMKKAIREHAEKLIREYGDAAYQMAQQEARTARRRRNSRLQHFLEKVAREIARRAHAKDLDVVVGA